MTLFFGALALLGGVGLTVATYFFARNSLLDQHETNARADAIRHAEQLNDALITDPDDVSRTLFELDIEPDGFAVLMTQPRQLQSRIGFDEENFPAELRESVTRGQSGQQQFVDDDGTPYLGVGISLQAFGVGYLEAFPLDTTERTLQVLATALTVGSILATIVAVFFGW